MHFFKKFMPDVFNILTIEEKKNIIDELTTYLCNDFNLEPIPVVFDNKLDKQNDHLNIQVTDEKEWQVYQVIKKPNIKYEAENGVLTCIFK